MGKLIFGALVGAFGGALSGAILGFAESFYVSFASAAADEYWLYFFAVIVYGLVGAAFGLGSAIAWQIVRGGRAGAFEGAQLGAALGFLLPGLFVTRYYVSKRIFNEQLDFASASGIIAHVLILVAVALATLLVVGLVRFIYQRAGWIGTAVGFVAAVAIAALIGTLTGAADGASPQRTANAGSGRPNVVLVVADTLRSDVVADRAKAAPDGGFARLSNDSVLFQRARSQASWTRPSVASILTSQYPSSHGTVHKLDFMSDRVLTVAETLKDAGYWTTGVTTNINVAPIFNLDQGFEEFTYLEPTFYFGATDSAAKLVIYKTLRTLRERFFADRVFYEHFYQDAEVVNTHVEKWLAEKPPEPFFLFLHYMDPHDPYFEIPYNGSGVARVTNQHPEADRVEELRGLYLQGVRYLDDHVRDLLAMLDDAGVYKDSVVVFTADHGEEFYEHEGWWHGTSLYDEQLHVPLIIKKPGSAQGGAARADPVRSIDIAPSILGAAGVRQPPSFQGVDVFQQRVTEPIIAEEDLEGNRLFSIVSGDWKLITANVGNPRGLDPKELYNLADDPRETKNLAASNAQKVSELENVLRSMLPPGTID